MTFQNFGQSLVCFLLGAGIILMLITLPGCRSGAIPKVDVSFWAGDPAMDGISRAQEDQTISCRDAEFSEFVCMTYADLRKLYDTMLMCNEWGTKTMNTKEKKEFLKSNREVLIHAIQSPRKRHLSRQSPEESL